MRSRIEEYPSSDNSDSAPMRSRRQTNNFALDLSKIMNKEDLVDEWGMNGNNDTFRQN